MVVVTKKKFVHSFLWSTVEKYSSQGVSFLVSIVMARLLTPKEYGVLGIISIFIGISEIFINSGLTNALISQKECNKSDYYTANWINIGISTICYLVLYFVAPFLADFYKMPIITPAMRILNLCLIIGAISGVSRTILTRSMKFKQMSVATLLTAIFSGIIGLSLAYLGFGIWALIYQSVLSITFSSICVMYLAKYTPSLKFSKESFQKLFGFGSKILASDIIWVIYNNIYPLIIGKGFGVQDVGLFNRASSYSKLIPSNFSNILEKVLFPAFANLQNDEGRLKLLYGKAITFSSFVVFSGAFFLLGLAQPLIVCMITDKWIGCVPLLQILCIGSLFGHLSSINGRLLIVKGFPGKFLKMAIITRPIELILIVLSFMIGIEAMAWSIVISSLIDVTVNSFFLYRHTGINIMHYLKYSFRILFISAPLGITSLLLFKYYVFSNWTNLIIVGVCMALLYLIFIWKFMPFLYLDLKSILKNSV